MIETNFVERGMLEVDKDSAKNKWRWDWLEAQVYISYFISLFFCVSKKMGERKVLTLKEAKIYS